MAALGACEAGAALSAGEAPIALPGGDAAAMLPARECTAALAACEGAAALAAGPTLPTCERAAALPPVKLLPDRSAAALGRSALAFADAAGGGTSAPAAPANSSAAVGPPKPLRWLGGARPAVDVLAGREVLTAPASGNSSNELPSRSLPATLSPTTGAPAMPTICPPGERAMCSEPAGPPWDCCPELGPLATDPDAPDAPALPSRSPPCCGPGVVAAGGTCKPAPVGSSSSSFESHEPPMPNSSPSPRSSAKAAATRALAVPSLLAKFSVSR